MLSVDSSGDGLINFDQTEFIRSGRTLQADQDQETQWQFEATHIQIDGTGFELRNRTRAVLNSATRFIRVPPSQYDFIVYAITFKVNSFKTP
jgi:hypothetical protein